MVYKVLDISNYDDMINEYLDEFKEEFDYDSSKEMVMKGKDKFKKFIKPIIINEFNHQLNDYPDLLENAFTYKGNNTYISDMGAKFIIEKHD